MGYQMVGRIDDDEKVKQIDLYIMCGDTCLAESGEDVFELITMFLIQYKYVVLNFEKIKVVTNAFLDIMIGRLYGIFHHGFLSERILPPINIDSEDLYCVSCSVKKAKKFFKERYKND